MLDCTPIKQNPKTVSLGRLGRRGKDFVVWDVVDYVDFSLLFIGGAKQIKAQKDRRDPNIHTTSTSVLEKSFPLKMIGSPEYFDSAYEQQSPMLSPAG